MESVARTFVGKQIHGQYQSGDELLGNRNAQSKRVAWLAIPDDPGIERSRSRTSASVLQCAWLGVAPQHRCLAGHRSDRYFQSRNLAYRCRLVGNPFMGTLFV